MEHPNKVERQIDLLQLHFCNKEGGSVALTYAYEDLQSGTDLLAAREMADTTWRKINIYVTFNDYIIVYVDGDENKQYVVTLDSPTIVDNGERGDEILELMSFSYLVSEWDDLEQRYVSFIVDQDDWDNYLDSLNACENVLNALQEQLPEHLDIIAGYMEVANGLGSEEAHAWLADYYGEIDSRYEAWV